MTKTIILIPSRLGATRLPNKPLLKIKIINLLLIMFMIKGLSTQIGDVYVATGDKEIFEEVINNNGKSILTNKKHSTGTDRIFEAFEQLKDKNIDFVINLQGDEPLIDTNDIIRLNNLAINNNCDIYTACKLEKKILKIKMLLK